MALYLITGGAGFIGSHLADALIARGDKVRVLDDLSTGKLENLPRGAEFIEGDVADAATVQRAMQGVAGCFHLAAIASVARSNEDWLGTHRTNLTGTVTVLDAARAAGCTPVVYASSAAIYGNPASMPNAESTAAQPLTAYGADKLGSELHAAIAWRAHGAHLTPLGPQASASGSLAHGLAQAGWQALGDTALLARWLLHRAGLPARGLPVGGGAMPPGRQYLDVLHEAWGKRARCLHEAGFGAAPPEGGRWRKLALRLGLRLPRFSGRFLG